MKHIFVLVLLQIGVAASSPLCAQITLTNPSFESNMVFASKADGWDTCMGFYTIAAVPTPYPPVPDHFPILTPPPQMAHYMLLLLQMAIIQLSLVT